jgi:WD40 repeat protein
MKRFALYGRAAVEQAPLQVYYSTLVFTPTNSIVKQRFANDIPACIKRSPQVEREWNALLQTLEGHTHWVEAVVFSPDGKTMASASGDHTVKLWNAGTGTEQRTLKGHTGWVRAVVFSPDGKTVASASGDKTVKLWDAGTGVEFRTLQVHGFIYPLKFSHDWSHLITDRGTFPTLLVCNGQYTTAEPVSAVSVRKNWVLRGEDNFILLPPEHRPITVATYRSLAVFGYATGAVSILELTE